MQLATRLVLLNLSKFSGTWSFFVSKTFGVQRFLLQPYDVSYSIHRLYVKWLYFPTRALNYTYAKSKHFSRWLWSMCTPHITLDVHFSNRADTFRRWLHFIDGQLYPRGELLWTWLPHVSLDSYKFCQSYPGFA